MSAVELYVEYEPKMLLPFLRSSQHYTLEKAYEICDRRDLLREQVFILGRMGNSKQALAVIINELGDIEEADCVNLSVKYYNEAKRAVCLSNEEDDARSKRDASRASQVITPSVRNMEVKSKTRGGGRCCMCFDPFSIQNVSVVVFFCCHAYHTICLMESTEINSTNKKGTGGPSEGLYEYEYEEEQEDDNGSEAGGPRMRCILCTTATS
ncbi:hypothetical protein GOBAR_DD35388 [Gossypium barbadense]|nr:hypothetical protein GOBAR_DD35388 [Gossypium barbadense]